MIRSRPLYQDAVIGTDQCGGRRAIAQGSAGFRHRALGVSTALFATAMLALGGCSQQPPAQLLVLNATPPAQLSPDVRAVVRVAQLSVPEYLDGFDVLVRTGDHRLTPDPDSKWAERLPAAMTRALRAGLRSRGYADGDMADLELVVDVDRFEPVLGGDILLVARWRVTDGTRRTAPPVARGDAVIRHPVAGPGGAITQSVAAMDAAMADLVGRIATDLDKAPISR